MKKMFRRILVGATMLAAGATLGTASTITYYIDVFGLAVATTTPIGTASATLADPNTSVNFSVPKLDQTSDPNPGHIYSLTAVNLTVNWLSTGEVDVFNSWTSGINFTNAKTTVPLTLTADSTTVTAVTNAGPVSGTAACCNTVTPFGGLSGTGSTGNPAADLNFFQGFGNNSFTANLTSGDLSAGGNSADPHALGHLFFGGSAQAGAIVTVTYNYTEVATPEPLTFALVGSSLIGLGLVIRRKHSKKA